MTLSIKMEPELRHALAHMAYAIEALAKGERAEALYEIESIKALIFWDSDEGQTVDAREWLTRNHVPDDDPESEEDHAQHDRNGSGDPTPCPDPQAKETDHGR